MAGSQCASNDTARSDADRAAHGKCSLMFLVIALAWFQISFLAAEIVAINRRLRDM